MTDFILVITVPTSKATDILDSITDHLGYSDPEGNNGAGTRSEYLRLQIKDQLKDIYMEAKQRQAAVAVDIAKDDANAVDFE